MQGSKPIFLRRQRGISLSGLIVVMAILGACAVLGMKVFPSVIEYRGALDGIKTAKATNGTKREMQASFDKTVEINNITSIAGKDIMVDKETGETEVSFAYEKRIPLFGNVSLVIDYSGTTDKTGRIGTKAEKNTLQ